MPLYEYSCENKKCKRKTYEESLPLKDYNKPTKCPDCGEIGKKLPGLFPVHKSWSKWRDIV